MAHTSQSEATLKTVIGLRGNSALGLIYRKEFDADQLLVFPGTPGLRLRLSISRRWFGDFWDIDNLEGRIVWQR